MNYFIYFTKDDLHAKDDSVNSAPFCSSSKPSLSKAQVTRIDKVFAQDIESGIELSRKCIVALMMSDPLLRTLANSQAQVKKVVDCVHYIFDNRPIVDPFQLPKENPAKRTAQFVALNY